VKKYQPPPEIAEIVRYFMPDASDEELKEATVNFRAYLAVLYRIFLRLEAEGRLDEIRDFPPDNDRVKEPNNDQI
jgi:2,3-bisphosphoglycerate-independent phosphoglycerate mutase